IHDNGGNISSEQKERVFEQFYRIPKGDVHDVKGFGIGLYYVKKILEKHEGKIDLETGKNSTTFITYWP
ncbi:MAG: ATP-binding protein, partial [Cytophagales bacterium]